MWNSWISASTTPYFTSTNQAWGDEVVSILNVTPTVPIRLIRCEYCKVKNMEDEPYCIQCGAPLPD